MKKLFTLLTIFVMASGLAFAQDNDTEAVQCTTVVISSLSIEKDQDLDFGTVAQGVGEISIAVSDVDAVKLTIAGQAAYDVIISYTSPSNFETSGGDLLAFSADIKSNSSDVPASSSALSSGASLTLNSSGNYFVYLGGTIDVLSSQAIGYYTGEVSFDVEYDL